jgi:hypothetical protein
MTAGGTVVLAGLGGAAGVFAANVAMDEWTAVRYDPVKVAAVGGAIGAALGTFIAVSLAAADAKKPAGSLSGPPLQVLGWP